MRTPSTPFIPTPGRGGQGSRLEVIQDKIDFDVKEVGPQGFTFTAALTTKPEVTIENYKASRP